GRGFPPLSPIRGAPPPPLFSAESSDSRRNSFSEFVRMVAGQTATMWQRETSQEIALTFQADPLPPEAVFTQGALLQVSAENLAEGALTLLVSQEMSESLETFKFEPPTEHVSAASPSQSASSSSPTEHVLPSNLELLLDVELEATIRFGERDLLLRDIFALMPGSVVELNQTLNEPAE